MPDFNELLTQAYRVLDTARKLNDESKRNGVNFVNVELDLSMTFAERSLTSFSAGHVEKAKPNTSAARAAYQAIQKLLPRLRVKEEEREQMDATLADLATLIEKLSTIR
jgi:hypothetical protein